MVKPARATSARLIQRDDTVRNLPDPPLGRRPVPSRPPDGREVSDEESGMRVIRVRPRLLEEKAHGERQHPAQLGSVSAAGRGPGSRMSTLTPHGRTLAFVCLRKSETKYGMRCAGSACLHLRPCRQIPLLRWGKLRRRSQPRDFGYKLWHRCWPRCRRGIRGKGRGRGRDRRRGRGKHDLRHGYGGRLRRRRRRRCGCRCGCAYRHRCRPRRRCRCRCWYWRRCWHWC